MEKEILTFIIIGDETSNLDGKYYKYNNDNNLQHIDALFKTYEYFRNLNYYITPFKPFREIKSFIEMIVFSGHIVYINMFNNKGLLFVPDNLTDKQRESLIKELNNLKENNIKISTNMNEFENLNENKLMKGK